MVVPVAAADELCAVRWVLEKDLGRYAQPYQSARIREVLANLEAGSRHRFMELGVPISA